MIDLLFEGTESLRLPCSWVLLIPGAAVAVFGRRRPILTSALFIGAAMLIAWLRFSGWWFAVPSGAVQVVLGLALSASAWMAWRRDSALTDAWVAVVAGTAASWAWIPCVGPHLGEVLNGSRTEPFDHIGGTVAFLTGQFLPLILISAVGVVFPGVADRCRRRGVIAFGAAAVATVGLLFATTLFDDLASELARRSNPSVLSSDVSEGVQLGHSA